MTSFAPEEFASEEFCNDEYPSKNSKNVDFDCIMNAFFDEHNYCCCCCYYWLLLLSLFPWSFWLCVMGAWAGAGYGWRGLWLVAGRAGFWGALATWVGVNSSSP